MKELKPEILAEANRLGFLLAGVAPPERPASFPIFEHWLQAGRHGEMAYLATDRARLRRADPRLILPEVKSVLVLGFPYRSPVDRQSKLDQENTGRVAAYAAGADYHNTIPPLLERIAEFAQERSGLPIIWRGYSDTGPILERELAARAGLGWIGKNSCLISPKFGSYFLLAEIFWDLPLEAEAERSHDYCGSCSRCVDACPTGCILPDRTLDARRCISYLTIENKGDISPELRPMTGNWVFGCDICQQVCPWNIRFSSARPETGFPGLAEDQQVQLTGELSLTPQHFNRKYRLSPILRAKRRGYLRNICIALGNRPNPAAIPHLRALLLAEPEMLVRTQAAWALGQIGGQEASEALKAALQKEIEPRVIAEIKSTLLKF